MSMAMFENGTWGEAALDKAVLMGEVEKGLTTKGVELYFFPHHSVSTRDVYQHKEEADRHVGHLLKMRQPL